MSNSERVVLALGGAGTVGSGIVKALLDKGKLDMEKQRKPLSPARRIYSTGNIVIILFEEDGYTSHIHIYLETV